MNNIQGAVIMRKRTIILGACIVCGMVITGCSLLHSPKPAQQSSRSFHILSDAVPIPQDWESRLAGKDRLAFKTGAPPFEVWYFATQAQSIFGKALAETLGTHMIASEANAQFGRELITHPLVLITDQHDSSHEAILLHYYLIPPRDIATRQ